MSSSTSLLPPDTELELMVNDSPDSTRAIRLLRFAGIPFRKVYMSGDDLPTVRLGDSTYIMYSGVQSLVRVLTPGAYERFIRSE